ncbi:MAG: DHH family phosphoesterase [Candidatus Paceibacterota bacterium]
MVSKKQAEEILLAVKKAKHILLHLHPSPDWDSVGGVLAIQQVLLDLGNKVTVIAGDSPLPTEFAVLPGFNRISEKTFFDLNLSDYDLFIILDSSDRDRISRLAPVVWPKSLTTIVIDHHISNPAFGDINLLDTNAPATCQILFELFDRWPIDLSPAVAICLFVGLYGDTGGFRYSPTTGRTLAMAASLVDKYPDFSEILSDLSAQNTPGQIKFRSLAYRQVATLGRGLVGIIAIDHQDIINNGFTKTDANNQDLANQLISVKDWLVGISAVEKDSGKTLISFRSRDSHRYNVAKVAARLAGGGHPAAAGASFAGPASEAKVAIEKILLKLYPDLF